MKQTVYFLAKCALFVSESAHNDKNDLAPMVLTPIGGQAPRGRNIVSGTIAKSEGFEAGKVYLVMGQHTGQVELEDGSISESFNYTNVAEYESKSDIIEYVMEHPLSDPLVATVATTPEGEIPQVKGNPRAKRIRDLEVVEDEKPETTKKERTA